MDVKSLLDIWALNLPVGTRQHLVRTVLDEETYQRVIPFLVAQEAVGAESTISNHTKNEVSAALEPENSEPKRITRRFKVPNNNKCKQLIEKEKNDIRHMGMELRTKRVSDLLEVTVEGEDNSSLSEVIVQLFAKIGRTMKKERELPPDLAEIALNWSNEVKATFMIKTSCNMSIGKKHGKSIMKLYSWSAKQVDDGVAQITVTNNEEQPKVNQFQNDSDDTHPAETDSLNLNFVLFGVKGVGRTMLVNSLANYVKHITIEEAKLKDLEILAGNEYSVQNGDETFTVEMKPSSRDADDLEQPPVVHSFEAVVEGKVRNVQIMDTEGISEDLEESLRHVDVVIDSLKKLGPIHGVVLVLDASSDRVQPTFLPILRQFFGKLHHNIQRNVMFCFTRAGQLFTADSISPHLKDLTAQLYRTNDILLEFNRKNSFCFDNVAFSRLYASKLLKRDDLLFPQASVYWENSCSEAKRLLQTLSEKTPADCSRLPFLGLLSSMKLATRESGKDDKMAENMENLEENLRKAIDGEKSTSDNPLLQSPHADLEQKLVSWLREAHDYPEADRNAIIEKITGEEHYQASEQFPLIDSSPNACNVA